METYRGNIGGNPSTLLAKQERRSIKTHSMDNANERGRFDDIRRMKVKDEEGPFCTVKHVH